MLRTLDPPCCPACPPNPAGGRADRVGLVFSVGCAVHCAAMPAVMVLAPALAGSAGGSWLAGEGVHLALLPACAAAAWCAVRSGVRRHGRRSVAAPAAAGLALLAAAVALPHTPAFAATPAAGDGSAGGCTAACCAASAAAVPAAGDTPAVAAVRSALPWLTPLGGGLLVLAHLFNLLAPPRAAFAP